MHDAKGAFAHVRAASGRSEAECRRVLDQLRFTDAMLEGTIGELSGGWQMKLRLAQVSDNSRLDLSCG